jgi:hypothetical protein
MAEIEAEAEINADEIIYGKRYFNPNDDLDIEADLDVKIDADVDAVHHGHRYHQRSGLLNNKNGVAGAVGVSPLTTLIRHFTNEPDRRQDNPQRPWRKGFRSRTRIRAQSQSRRR